MKETSKRVISALILLSVALTCVYIGGLPLVILATLGGILTNDEISCNLLKKRRFSPSYNISQACLVAPVVYLIYIDYNIEIYIQTAILTSALNLMLVIYLFFTKIESRLIINWSQKVSFLTGLLVLLPLLSLGALREEPEWRGLIMVLAASIWGMDSGAWFFGNKLGKTPLSPKVSPKKTWEGLIGGVVISCAIGGTTAFTMLGTTEIRWIFLSGTLGLLSHLGDLIQSKIKRQCEIKDSSQLIPGHGGVYDRTDSLLFISPFFILFVEYVI